MKPTLEQIKTDESVWPDGASHYINSVFVKWVKCVELICSGISSEWYPNITSWPLEKYEKKGGFNIIPRPTKAEWVPKVGEWCEALLEGKFKKAQALKYHNETSAIAFDFIDCLKWSADYRPIKTERELLIEIIEATGNMSNGVLADNILNAGFIKEPAK